MLLLLRFFGLRQCDRPVSGAPALPSLVKSIQYCTQQIIFHACRAIIERMIRDPGRSIQTSSSSSSQDLTSILDKHVPEWIGKDAIDGLCFPPPWVHSYACLDLPMNRLGVPRSSRSIFAECESSKTHRQSQPIRAERSSNDSQRSHRALAGSSRTRAHKDDFLTSNGELVHSLRNGDSEPRRSSPRLSFSLRFLPSRLPALLWILHSSIYDVYYVTTGMATMVRIGRTATAVRPAFIDFIERSSIKGTVPRNGFLCWSFLGV